MTTQFCPIANTFSLTANVTAVQTSIPATGVLPGTAAQVVNVGNVTAFLAFGVANTTTAKIANATSSGTGFPVAAGATVYIQYGGSQTDRSRVYISGITSSGTAQVFITPGITS